MKSPTCASSAHAHNLLILEIMVSESLKESGRRKELLKSKNESDHEDDRFEIEEGKESDPHILRRDIGKGVEGRIRYLSLQGSVYPSQHHSTSSLNIIIETKLTPVQREKGVRMEIMQKLVS